MTDIRTTNLAEILVNYCLEITKGDRVAVLGTSLAEPLMLELERYILRAGGHPELIARIPGSDYVQFTEASNEQLEYISPLFKMVIEEYEGLIQLYSTVNTRALTNVPAERQGIRAKSMSEIMKRYHERSASGDLRWVVSMFPTVALAQEAEMSLHEFEDFVYGATYADHEDPVKAWQRIHDQQQRLVEWLKGKQEIVVKGSDVDLKLSIQDREFINSDGKFNMPSGEIYTSPVEDSAEGWIRFSYPAIQGGREVTGVELTFEAGQVVKAGAEKNDAFLQEMLAVDEGAKRLGEFAIGTNVGIDRFIGNILFDEKLGGTIHLALGNGFPEIGGVNTSVIHWDMLCDMRDGGKIFVDGELFYDSGEFKI